jgi:heme/copper-type cytochrome/quinol oxidase subunit 2
VRTRRAARAALAAAVAGIALGLPALARAGGSTNLAETSPLVWVMIAISIGGSIITFAILVYSIWRYRDPAVRGRRYG